MKKIEPLLIDIYTEKGFYCQLKYVGKSKKKKGVESFNSKDIERFIFEQRPSLKYMKFSIDFSDQPVENRYRPAKNIISYNNKRFPELSLNK